MLDQIKGFHIEPTNMCTSKCPRCSRTEFIEKFPKRWTNKNLKLDHLKNFLDINLQGKNISLCGNYGDPIYYDQLFEMINFFKEQGCSIRLATNGSYKTEKWWKELIEILTSEDEVIFGIDGLPENYMNYRINSEWESVLAGLRILANSKIKTVWQCIPFSFNENKIDAIKNFALNIGVDEFLLLPSNRWVSNQDELKPSTPFAEERIASNIIWTSYDKTKLIDPQCKKDHNQHFISADGYYLPCCYIGDYRFYYKTEFYKNRDLYDISKTTITEVLTSLTDFYSTLEDAKLNYCTFNCPKL